MRTGFEEGVEYARKNLQPKKVNIDKLQVVFVFAGIGMLVTHAAKAIEGTATVSKRKRGRRSTIVTGPHHESHNDQ